MKRRILGGTEGSLIELSCFSLRTESHLNRISTDTAPHLMMGTSFFVGGWGFSSELIPVICTHTDWLWLKQFPEYRLGDNRSESSIKCF